MDKLIVGSFLVLVFLVILALLVGFPIMWLWNWLCPGLFKLPIITFWQAIGLFALIRCLFPTRAKV
jgi:hypothetical protein